jgi:hypothetical protein
VRQRELPAEVHDRPRSPEAAPLVAQPALPPRDARLHRATVVDAQRTMGNAAVGRLLARQSKPGDLMDPDAPDVDIDWDEIVAEQEKLGEQLRDELIGLLSGRDAILFNSRLRALSDGERAALRNDDKFWWELRKFLWGYSLWSVRLRLQYGKDTPPEVRELSTAIFSGDWYRTRTLLFGYDSLKKVPGLREVIAYKFQKAQADDLFAILVESQTRAESGLSHYKEAHYESGVMASFTGDRNYELVRTNKFLRVVVRIGLKEDPANKQHSITDAVVSRWEQGITSHWNGKFRLRSGGKTLDIWFVPVFIFNEAATHHQVKVTEGGSRSNEGNWYADVSGETAAHEFGHMLGNPDEYNLPATAAEIPASMKLTNAEKQRSSWEGITGEKKKVDTEGYDVSALMGAHYKSARVELRYAYDIAAVFNANLKQADEAAWTVEAQK